MDLQALMPWLLFANTAITLATAIYAAVTRGSKDNAAAITALAGRVGESERRIQALEAELKHLPDAQDVTELKLAMTEMRGTMNVQAEVMGTVARTVQRLEGYLLEKGK